MEKHESTLGNEYYGHHRFYRVAGTAVLAGVLAGGAAAAAALVAGAAGAAPPALGVPAFGPAPFWAEKAPHILSQYFAFFVIH